MQLDSAETMPVKMHQVSYFLALCEEHNFTRAAKRCGVAQPSLTRAIQQLEQEFGNRLFERNNTTVRLTDLGALVRPDFEQIDRATARVTQKVAKFSTSPPAKHDSRAMEVIMRVLAVTAIAVVLVIAAFTIRPAPHATAAAPDQARVQIDPYALHSRANTKSLPDQDVRDLY
ncbi:MAG TPA: LysR family transcriptional regulator [Candidatus Binatia bacterium]|nr:LysR family transcriptional regulator [Candidatus Binatia bacterium]